MTEASVLAFRPYVIMLDVGVELPLMTMQAVLAFGPFNSLKMAEVWASEVERLHKAIESKESECATAIAEDVGLPTGAFIRAYVSSVDIVQAPTSMRTTYGIIRPTTPEEDAREMHIYALKSFQAEIIRALQTREHESNG